MVVESGQKVVFYHRWCKACGICVEFCPRHALGVRLDSHPHLAQEERCNSCGLCEFLCPDFAITVPHRHGR
ncbi:MAG: 4Fe-4S binding protein [Chloroflexi bacterium]|nr:4Fe-4S binding protein [Chloroflexota bacterium]